MAKDNALSNIKSALKVLKEAKNHSKLTPKELSALSKVISDMGGVLAAQKTTKDLQKSLDKLNDMLKENFGEPQ